MDRRVSLPLELNSVVPFAIRNLTWNLNVFAVTCTWRHDPRAIGAYNGSKGAGPLIPQRGGVIVAYFRRSDLYQRRHKSQNHREAALLRTHAAKIYSIFLAQNGLVTNETHPESPLEWSPFALCTSTLLSCQVMQHIVEICALKNSLRF